MSVVVMNMMPKPTNIKVLRPALSINNKEMMVMPTFMAPMIRVATWDSVWSNPADRKMEVE